ncbi:unnamed protein product [Clavelina lepadiformis]|uniref:Uncharacterized protein n=1 Tax=Clavelina lepadiformis TaxID=159417 RepID=A0ABP0G234_CLALP
MVLKTTYPELVIPQVSFYKYNVDIMRQHGDKVALVNAGTGQQLTFREIIKFSQKLASAFNRKGLKKQEVVALCTANCLEYPIVVLGTAACNAITTTCNPLYTFDETLKQFENSQPRFVITESTQVSKMLKVAEKIPSIKEIFSIDPSHLCSSLWTLIEEDDGHNFPFLVSVDPMADCVLLPYSSGTTGVPKGVMITHHNMVALLVILRGLGKLAPWSITYSVIPMFHSYGLLRLFRMLHGVKNLFDKRFHIKNFLEAVEKYQITTFSTVPPILIQLANNPLVEKYDTSSLTVLGSGAAPLAPQVAKSAMQKMQSVIVQGWGMTEAFVITTLGMPGAPLTSVGFVVPNTKIKIVDPHTREELGVNEDGEILVKGPQVMKGYFRNPTANAKTFDPEGWLCTGDIGHYDENGMVYLVDRLKELIKYKGFQVAPAELESLILSHPKVRDVGVVGIPDAESGEVPKAYVVKKDSSLTATELNSFVEEKVSRYKYLRGGIEFIGEIPKSATGKILRRELRALSQSKL